MAIVCEFPSVFPDELPSLHPIMEQSSPYIFFQVRLLFLRHRMERSPTELKELKEQLQENLKIHSLKCIAMGSPSFID